MSAAFITPGTILGRTVMRKEKKADRVQRLWNVVEDKSCDFVKKLLELSSHDDAVLRQAQIEFAKGIINYSPNMRQAIAEASTLAIDHVEQVQRSEGKDIPVIAQVKLAQAFIKRYVNERR